MRKAEESLQGMPLALRTSKIQGAFITMSKKKLNTRMSLVSIYAFNKQTVGYKCRQNVSMYQIAASGLRLIGMQQNGMRDETFVRTYYHKILEHNNKNQPYIPPIKQLIPKPKSHLIYRGNPNTDEFLKSYEWRSMRMKVLRRDGAVCACCGATRSDGVRMHVDHIKPRKLFPQLALDENNLQVLCEECNHGKGNWDMTDWRKDEAADKLQQEITARLKHIFESRE